MVSIQFRDDEYKVERGGEVIALLPKEYALFRCLYENKNRAFSREQLLNQVWALEAPTDRTVDDHVYRLRKKLSVWGHLMTLETVRGIGYRLTVKAAEQMANPLLGDPEFMEQIQRVLTKYQQVGQGDAIRMLLEQQKMIGIEEVPFFTNYLHMIAGEFGRLVESDLPFWERAYALLHVYCQVTEDLEQALDFYERAIAAKKLPEPEHRELEILNVLDLYLWTGRATKAVERLAITHETVKKYDMEPFLTPVAITEVKVYLSAGDDEMAEAKLRESEALLEMHPYLRETGNFYITKGIWLLYRGQRREGERWIEEGFEVLERSRFVPITLRSLRYVTHYLTTKIQAPDLLARYRKREAALADRYRYKTLEPAVYRLLHQNLSP
ncbi:winged helix-turn-helix domain-containing protein [Tumebacillus sp. DT12]|uniref:Winged helix-turn-helix domain-containing protein n=1 Tax=Tumebacillus lacus TaxID=2995335 RepID=A0ABT3X4G6_9BACL|nr:winged helix-turn-helix domain-containing protein [Tumebacillus lacus]MCX7570727.1 winged helix-turn-helix domain-containing protein [Tumebacillus lacus]